MNRRCAGWVPLAHRSRFTSIVPARTAAFSAAWSRPARSAYARANFPIAPSNLPIGVHPPRQLPKVKRVLLNVPLSDVKERVLGGDACFSAKIDASTSEKELQLEADGPTGPTGRRLYLAEA